jgi:hypothetical protein
MRYFAIALIMLLYAAGPAHAQVSVGVSIGFNMSSYPRMVSIPGYPVYYDPQVDSNYFFYDGLYWVYQDDNWYSSSWYDGPWDLIGPEDVPLFVLRIPVRYYRHRPSYFSGWSLNLAPRWGDHWGRDWEQRRSGWDRWDRHSVPRAAPLPSYQRQYSGSRYPRAVEQQYSIQSKSYHYQPREAVTQQYFQRHVAPSGTSMTTPRPGQTPRPIDSTQNRNRTQMQMQQREKQTQDKAQVRQEKRAQDLQTQQQQRVNVQRPAQQRQNQAQDKAQVQQEKRAQDAQAQQQRVNVQRQAQQRQNQAQDQAQVQQQKRAQDAQAQQQRGNVQRQAQQQQTQQQQKRIQDEARQQQQQRAKPVQNGQSPAERKADRQKKEKEKNDKTDGGPGNSQ